MARERSSLNNVHKDLEGEKPVSTSTPPTPPIEPDEAADAQSRQRLIGKELRRWYDTIVKEPIPDELLDLLRQADSRKS